MLPAAEEHELHSLAKHPPLKSIDSGLDCTATDSSVRAMPKGTYFNISHASIAIGHSEVLHIKLMIQFLCNFLPPED